MSFQLHVEGDSSASIKLYVNSWTAETFGIKLYTFSCSKIQWDDTFHIVLNSQGDLG